MTEPASHPARTEPNQELKEPHSALTEPHLALMEPHQYLTELHPVIPNQHQAQTELHPTLTESHLSLPAPYSAQTEPHPAQPPPLQSSLGHLQLSASSSPALQHPSPPSSSSSQRQLSFSSSSTTPHHLDDNQQSSPQPLDDSHQSPPPPQPLDDSHQSPLPLQPMDDSQHSPLQLQPLNNSQQSPPSQPLDDSQQSPPSLQQPLEDSQQSSSSPQYLDESKQHTGRRAQVWKLIIATGYASKADESVVSQIMQIMDNGTLQTEEQLAALLGTEPLEQTSVDHCIVQKNQRDAVHENDFDGTCLNHTEDIVQGDEPLQCEIISRSDQEYQGCSDEVEGNVCIESSGVESWIKKETLEETFQTEVGTSGDKRQIKIEPFGDEIQIKLEKLEGISQIKAEPFGGISQIKSEASEKINSPGKDEDSRELNILGQEKGLMEQESLRHNIKDNPQNSDCDRREHVVYSDDSVDERRTPSTVRPNASHHGKDDDPHCNNKTSFSNSSDKSIKSSIHTNDGIRDDATICDSHTGKPDIASVSVSKSSAQSMVISKPGIQNITYYHCSVCDKIFCSRDQLIKHKDISHQSSSLVVHQVSAEKMPETRKLVADVKSFEHKKVKEHCCAVCNKVFRFRSDFLRHERSHQRVKRLKDISHQKSSFAAHQTSADSVCDESLTGSQTGKRLLGRYPTVTKSKRSKKKKSFPCEFCSKIFRFPSKLAEHARSHRRDTQYSAGRKMSEVSCLLQTHVDEPCKEGKEKEPDKPDNSSSHGEIESVPEMRQSAADVCMKSVHVVEKPHKCNVCGKKFASKAGLTRHVTIIHEGRRTDPCPVCGKTFKLKASLKFHVARHLGQCKFKCSVCGRGCDNAHALAAHMTVHTGKLPYNCSTCGVGFRSNLSLLRHNQLEHSSEGFECHKMQ